MINYIVDGVLPKHRHLVYQSTNEANVKDCEKRLHEKLGLKWGYLWHGIGFGGRSKKTDVPKPKLYTVMIYEYHRILPLLQDKEIKLNPNCLLSTHKRGPGSPPPNTDEGMEMLLEQMKLLFSEFPKIRYHE